MKVESCTSNKQVLKMEVAVLKRLQKSFLHVCEFLGCGRTDKVNYMVMTLLGPSLSELRKHQPHQRFSISTTLRTGLQILAAVQSMHDCGFLHRDIKPSNFAIGSTPATSRNCYMFDFGLARQYTTVTGEVRQPRQVAGFRGTVRYASLNAHLSRDLGRHDDLWSVFYLLVELAVGQLPWRRIRDKEEAGDFKAQFDHKKLIQGLPVELGLFLDYIKLLTYFDKPDYTIVASALQKAIMRLGIQESDPLDWEQDSCGPSMTSASVVSTPGMKVVGGSQDAAKQSMHKSRTNCSDVEELIENSSANQINKRPNSLYPKPHFIAQRESSPESPLQKWQQVEKAQGVISLIEKESRGIEESKNGNILDKNVQIDNYYVSEEEEEEEEEEEDSDKSEESNSSQESSQSPQSSPAACDIHMVTQSHNSLQSNKKPLMNEAVFQLHSASNVDIQDGPILQSDSLKNGSNSSPQVCRTRSMNTRSQSKEPSELNSDSNQGKHKENICSSAKEMKKDDPVIYPDSNLPAIVGFSLSLVEKEEMGDKAYEDERHVDNAGNLSVHKVDPGSESSLSNSVGVNSALRQIASLTTPLSNNNKRDPGNKQSITSKRTSIDFQKKPNIPGTRSSDTSSRKMETMMSSPNFEKKAKKQEDSKRRQDERPPVASLLGLAPAPKKKEQSSRKKALPTKSKISASLKSTQETGKFRKIGVGEEAPAKTPQDTEVLKESNPPNLEVVPSPVVLRPRPPPNPPPQHYSRTLQARRRRFMRPPHSGK